MEKIITVGWDLAKMGRFCSVAHYDGPRFCHSFEAFHLVW
jgi:hypothetical protein